jgi:uncharacterized OsmC-like protein
MAKARKESNMAEKEKTLNGLHPKKLNDILEGFRDPKTFSDVSGPWKSRIVWQSGFRNKAFMRTHVVEMDEPQGLDATDMAASAHEQLLSAVGSCMAVGFVLNATKRGIKVHDLEIAMEGYFDNIGKWAGIAPKGNPGYRGITAKAFVKADADQATLKELWKLAVDGSPVTQSVLRATSVTTEFEAV